MRPILTRILGLFLVVLLLALLVYLSRYWTFRWWDSGGLAGIEALRPQGDLVRRWLRGTPFSTYDIVAWGVGGLLLLSVIQSLWGRIFRG
jgi:hypothetical protein